MANVDSQQFMKDFAKSASGRFVIMLFSFIGLFLACWIAISVYRHERQSDDFIRRELNGTLVDIRDIRRGRYSITIKQHEKNEEIQYSLTISSFFKQNNIRAGDSISKSSNSKTVKFFKKRESSFIKCCEYICID
jgi:hypothetical protein